MKMFDTPVVNIYGGPGVGKSTTAAYLLYKLKVADYDAEIVTEYAKDVLWEDREHLLADQLYITAKQNRRLERLMDKNLNVIVTDSPLALGAIYCESGYRDDLQSLISQINSQYQNVFNVFIRRSTAYKQIGRTQTRDEAISVDKRILDALESMDIQIDYELDFDAHKFNGNSNDDLFEAIDEWLTEVRDPNYN